ncbi:ATP-binding protein [Spirillospora sp. NBC_01491]|uniref:ATP-binding protein n=1 Tax=Spirillospora sp. NBC_01491 TaxID=2976007 RepID=UPI002E2FD91E|nr:ATP-binding protein [Spirillospora sp. NBC_01491]
MMAQHPSAPTRERSIAILTHEVAGDAQQVSGIRALARTALAQHLPNLPDLPDLIDDVEMVLSELVGNAIRHTSSGRGGTVRTTIKFTPGRRVRIEVADDGGAVSLPRIGEIDRDAIGGRGLQVVDKLATTWNFRATREGTTIWAELTGQP